MVNQKTICCCFVPQLTRVNVYVVSIPILGDSPCDVCVYHIHHTTDAHSQRFTLPSFLSLILTLTQKSWPGSHGG